MMTQSEKALNVGHEEPIQRVRQFVSEEVAPYAAVIDRENTYPKDIYRRVVGQERLVGLTRTQGAGRTTLKWALWVEELAAASATLADVVCTADLVALILEEHGTEQQESYLGPLLAGHTMGASRLPRPRPDPRRRPQGTVAKRDGDSYVITGMKAWITCAQSADWAIVLAKTEPAADTRGISAFLAERGGFTNGNGPYDMMGQRGTAVGELHLDGCRVPASAKVGEPNEGSKMAMKALGTGRIGIAALAVGVARAAYEAGVIFTDRREQFGQRISSFQGIRWLLVAMATDTEAPRLLVHQAAKLRDAGAARHTKESAMAKLRASDVARRVTVDALQVHGATGYRKNEVPERFVRDAKLTQSRKEPIRYNARSSPDNVLVGHECRRKSQLRRETDGVPP